MKFLGIIPARYSSSRFPGKPLAQLGGKPVIQHVYERAKQVLTDVYVATDDERIYNVVTAFGGKAVMTQANHQSGTERACEALDKIEGKFDVVINIQGDEPFIQTEQIRMIMSCFDDEQTQIATLGIPLKSMQDVRNVNSPKIVLDINNNALYFSRSAIPFIRGIEQADWIGHYPFLKHIGLYAYRVETLHEISKLPPSSLELAERLEQLRWLQNGYRIKVCITNIETVSIDTPQDLERAKKYLKQNEQ